MNSTQILMSILLGLMCLRGVTACDCQAQSVSVEELKRSAENQIVGFFTSPPHPHQLRPVQSCHFRLFVGKMSVVDSKPVSTSVCFSVAELLPEVPASCLPEFEFRYFDSTQKAVYSRERGRRWLHLKDKREAATEQEIFSGPFEAAVAETVTLIRSRELSESGGLCFSVTNVHSELARYHEFRIFSRAAPGSCANLTRSEIADRFVLQYAVSVQSSSFPVGQLVSFPEHQF